MQEQDISATVEAALSAPVNGTEVMVPDHRTEQRKAAVAQGMQEFFAVVGERDHWKKMYEQKCLENAELVIAIEQAAENERLKVQKIVDEAVTQGKKAEAQEQVLHREMADLYKRLETADMRIIDLVAAKSKLEAFVDMIKAGIEKIRSAG